MANYYGSARSNYFIVKDADVFEKALEHVPDIEIDKEGDKYCILVTGGDFGGWPSSIWDDEKDIAINIDVPVLVSEHLVDGEVAIFMESGAEKLRYVIGYAVAINNKGETVAIGLDSIYDMAEELTTRPRDITRAEY